MYIVKVYVWRERKRSAPYKKLVLRMVTSNEEAEAIKAEYSEPFEVVVIKAYRGAK